MDSTLAKFPNIGLRVCKELYDRSLSNLEKNSSTRWRQSEKSKAAYHQAARIGNVPLIELILRKSMDKSPKGDLFLLCQKKISFWATYSPHGFMNSRIFEPM